MIEQKTLKSFGIDIKAVGDIPCEKADIQAIKALVRGEAAPDQQKRAVDWIITQAADFYGASFGASHSETDHHEGRRFVGWLIVNISNMRLIRRQEESNEQG